MSIVNYMLYLFSILSNSNSLTINNLTKMTWFFMFKPQPSHLFPCQWWSLLRLYKASISISFILLLCCLEWASGDRAAGHHYSFCHVKERVASWTLDLLIIWLYTVELNLCFWILNKISKPWLNYLKATFCDLGTLSHPKNK